MTPPLSLFVAHFLVLYLVSGTITLFFAIMSWRHRDITISFPFTLLMSALTVWFYGYVLELLSSDLPTSLFFNNVEVPCTLIVPAAFLLIILYYTGHEHYINRGTLLLLSIATVVISIVTMAV